MKYVTKTFTVEIVSDGWDMNIPLRSSEDVWHWAKPLYATLDADKEHFVLVVQNNKHKVQGHKVISTGTLTATLIHPREVYTAVLSPEWRAAAIIFLHNHPSGDPQPSPEDIEITRRLKEIGNLFGIRINDHLILGQDRFFSFSDRGLL